MKSARNRRVNKKRAYDVKHVHLILLTFLVVALEVLTGFLYVNVHGLIKAEQRQIREFKRVNRAEAKAEDKSTPLLYDQYTWQAGTEESMETRVGNLVGSSYTVTVVTPGEYPTYQIDDFKLYYENKFKDHGYTRVNELDYDGAEGGSWGYQKDDSYVVLSYRLAYQNEIERTLTFRVFIQPSQL